MVICLVCCYEYFRCDLKVLSDANQFFIETILKNHGIYDCFSDIITNPTFVDEQGRLRIFPYHGSAMPPHGCDLCPPNLCKVPELLCLLNILLVLVCLPSVTKHLIVGRAYLI